MDTNPRINAASPDMKPPYAVARIAWFWFVYNWETRVKTVIENDELFAHPEKLPSSYGPNEHLYRIEVALPPPVSERTDIELAIVPVASVNEEEETLRAVAPSECANYIARSFFLSAGLAVPKGTFNGGTGLCSNWLGAPNEGSSFELTCYGGKFRVTVEKVD
jgi:hypothetical protein